MLHFHNIISSYRSLSHTHSTTLQLYKHHHGSQKGSTGLRWLRRRLWSNLHFTSSPITPSLSVSHCFQFTHVFCCRPWFRFRLCKLLVSPSTPSVPERNPATPAVPPSTCLLLVARSLSHSFLTKTLDSFMGLIPHMMFLIIKNV